MGERKVLNKYYPSDFNPRKIPRRRQPKNQQMKVWMMLPMSIRCGTCNNYIYKGTKFNSRKEEVICEEVDKEKQKRDTEEMGDAMKSLANRTLDSKREMDILAALDEVKSMRSRQATISVDAMLEILQRSAEEKEKKLEEEDEALIKSLFGAPREVVRRIDDDILDDDVDLSQISTDNTKTSNNNSKV
ncbi:splicing factor YJU2-like [Camellia sinensis]|uniref:splicing factor YJU2-like n=1 Tax=Camellia sinensis TaxID=4442 RepID=UPI001035DBFD|nr:splicing factor YJU2-like [Camellia sinensis]